jgi:hypothetical protein
MSATEAPGRATEALVERLFRGAIETLEVASVHVGGRLGFCRALADAAEEAGFGRVDVLPIEHDMWRFYRLVP